MDMDIDTHASTDTGRDTSTDIDLRPRRGDESSIWKYMCGRDVWKRRDRIRVVLESWITGASKQPRFCTDFPGTWLYRQLSLWLFRHAFARCPCQNDSTCAESAFGAREVGGLDLETGGCQREGVGC